MDKALPKPGQAPPTENAPQETKPKKEKKPPTEAQQAARQKGLQAMMAKRKELAEKQNEKKEVIKKAKKAVEDKILKEDVGFVMKNDFEALRKELYELKANMRPQVVERVIEKQVPAPKQERIVERVIEVPSRSTTPQRMTGTALLDKVFGFN